MPNIFIDTYLFACPKVDEGKDIFLAYVNDLLEWRALSECEWAQIYILRESYSVLAKQNDYPIWNHLKKMIETYAIDYVQPDAIVTLVNSFLNKFNQIDSALEIIDVLADNVSTDPSNHIDIRLEDYKDIYKKTLVYMFLKSSLHEEQFCEQLLITTGINCNRVSIEAEIVLIDFYEDSENAIKIQLPLSFKEVFSSCKNYDGLLLAISPELMWLKSSNQTAYKMCIIINSYIMSRELDSNITPNDLIHFEIGDGFINSVRSNGFNNNPKRVKIFLKSVSELILNIHLNKTHALREGKGANEHQIENNGFKAWRRDIDHEYHLHYWKKGEHIILSCIVTHNDYNIIRIS